MVAPEPIPGQAARAAMAVVAMAATKAASEERATCLPQAQLIPVVVAAAVAALATCQQAGVPAS